MSGNVMMIEVSATKLEAGDWGSVHINKKSVDVLQTQAVTKYLLECSTCAAGRTT
jgi:hypothetical protein